MPYPVERPAWQSFLDPIYKAFNGDDYFDDINLLWDRDEPGLDPWERGRPTGLLGGDTITVGSEQQLDVEPLRITLPKTSSAGDNEADRRAALRGVDPGRATGGIGQIIDLMKTQLGSPYVWGASNPDVGFDCSGAVYWAFSRAGFNLPRTSAEGYQDIFTPVSREELQPGDVIFYNYGRKGPGKADHIEVYMGGGKQIGTSNVNEDFDIDEVDWDNVIGFGRAPGVSGTANPATSGGNRSKVVKKPILRDQSLAPLALAGGEPDMTAVLADTFQPDEYRIVTQGAPKGLEKKGVKGQLMQGFRDAGRTDLAKMVRTKAFQVWIDAESRWRVDVTSPANNHGLANDGLFQVWRGHSFNSDGRVAQMSAYEQARLIARYFGHLTPAKIREYAEQVENGTYGGWG